MKSDDNEGGPTGPTFYPRRRKRRAIASTRTPTRPQDDTSSPSYSSNGSCCCCCSSSSTCSITCSSDSDERFTRYYQLSSDDAELRGMDIPAESRKQRRGMVKLLLHTMVMWDDIWRIRNYEEDSDSSSDEDKKNKRREERNARRKRRCHDHSDDDSRNKPPRVATRASFFQTQEDKQLHLRKTVTKLQDKTKEEEELTQKIRLKQVLNMTEDNGVFFSGKWYGQPLEEIDPYIYDDTFCVLSWKPKPAPCVVYRYFKGDSVGLFAPDHPVRTFALSVVTHRYFSRCIVLTILANCITLAMESYEYDEFGMRVEPELEQITELLELVFLAFYTTEMVLKVIAKGFVFQKMAYLRNGWNVLDFIVVISSYVTILVQLIVSDDDDNDATSLEFLRIFRVLRAVKTVSILPRLRKIVNSLINSSVQLFEVMSLTVFAMVMFSLFGMEFFGGKFRNKCVRIQGLTNEDDMDPEYRGITKGLSTFMTDRLYGMWVENEHNWLYRDSPDTEPVPCGNSSTARACPDGYVCLEVPSSDNPNNGWISFDTFYLAAMQTLQVMTLDYWERIYELALSTVGSESVFFFIIVIFLGGYYILNLMLAVVTLSYEKEITQLDVNNSKLPLPKRLTLARNLSTFNFEHLNQQRLRLFEGFRQRPPKERDELLLRMIKADEFAHPVMKHRFESSLPFSHAVYRMLNKAGRYRYHRKSQAELSQQAALDQHRTSISDKECYEEFEWFDGESDAELVDEEELEASNGRICNFNMEGFDQVFFIQDMSKFMKRHTKEMEFDVFPPEPQWENLLKWMAVCRKMAVPIVEDWKFRNFMTFCIFVNTVISCLEHHRQPHWLDILIYISNDVFTYIFTFELFLKAVAHQRNFFQYGWNKFDLYVVLGSILDNILQNTLGFKGLRGLKLLRILRLAQAWETMKIMLNILISAIAEMANLVMILFIAIYIFAVFGMQYVGNGYAPRSFDADFYPANYPRWAWQTTIHAFLMVFRVVCGEWVELISECLNAYKKSNEQYKCFLTFIPTLIFGNFIVLNLFLALLLHIFDADELNSQNRKKNMKTNRRGPPEQSFRANMHRLWKRLKAKFSKEPPTTVQAKKEKKTSEKIRSKIAKLIGSRRSSKVGPETSLQNQIDEDGSTSETMSGSSYSETESTSTVQAPSKTASKRQRDLPKARKSISQKYSEIKRNDGNDDKSKADMAPSETAETENNPAPRRRKRIKIILPHPNPKWRLYKVVMKYKELIGADGDIDDDEDLEDNDLLDVPKEQVVEIENKLVERTKSEHYKNRRFREIAYRVILRLRKERAIEAIRMFLELKSIEMRNACETVQPEKSGKERNGSVDEMIDALEEEAEAELSPCFPSSWYSNTKCFLCWIWGSHHPCTTTLNSIRKRTLQIVNHSYFEWIMLVIIIASSVLLCFDDVNLDKNKTLQDILFYSSVIFTIVFIIEFILKVFAYGVYDYFTNIWFILDFALVLIGIVAIISDVSVRSGFNSGALSPLNSLKVLRALKALRPLRAISRWRGMKMVVNSLIQAIPSIFNVLCVCLVFWLVFAIMGVQFFKGRMYKCVNEIGETVDASIAPNKQICCQKADAFNFAWVNTFPNFDSVPQAYIALLYLATFEGWIDVIRAATDARDMDQQPVRDYDPYAQIYIVCFCLFGGFLTTKLFIGVIIDNFNVLKKKAEGNLFEALMSPSQLKYYFSVQKLGRKKPRIVLPKPKNPSRLAFFEISISQRGEFFMFIVILLNMVVMCLDSYGHSLMQDALLESLSAFFIFIYTLEAIVKMIGLGAFYFKSGWNIFDLSILIISLADYIIGDMLGRSFPVPPSMVRICRVLRVGRVMRLMKSAKGVRRLVFALLVSLPALFNVGALLVLIICIYSILGMSLFGRIGYGGAFDEITNFETFPNAFLLLFRLITSSGWNDVLDTLTIKETYCGDPDEDDCGGPGEPECTDWTVSLAFMVSYLIITNFVIVNMYIAIILENYHQATEQDELAVSEDDIDDFFSKWAVFDGNATQYMQLKYISPFLNSLEPPMQFRVPNQISITALNIPIYQGQVVHILDVMRNMIVFILGQAETQQMEEIQHVINTRFTEKFRQTSVLPLICTTRIWKIQHNAAVFIQKTWRENNKRRKQVVRLSNPTGDHNQPPHRIEIKEDDLHWRGRGSNKPGHAHLDEEARIQ